MVLGQYMIGDGENLMDFTYVGNVVQAHLLAAEKLQPGSPVAGQAYFITNQVIVLLLDCFLDSVERRSHESSGSLVEI